AAKDAAELAALIAHYKAAWGARRIVLAGYSFGGSALPAIARRLPAEAWKQIRSLVLIAPRDYVELTLRPHSWLDIKPPHAPPLTADLQALPGVRVVCVYGEKDRLAACPRLPAGMVEAHKLPGGHKFDGDYADVAAIMAREAR
ncbi:MAG TPA: AcvB/VirJ family lysyl-phosphatidylglycerol hydrolase, partial [Caulobacteraceae bacterium]|nr:AcvB/VirJ family lysyl-phosphatidylglycerol hydrolase [Caulobacteraceae bacterium]